MSRYIDADDAVAKYAHYGIDHYYDATDLEEILDEMPSIDIVFCKDCKYTDGNPPIADGRSWCVLHGSFMYYCSDGERSER